MANDAVVKPAATSLDPKGPGRSASYPWIDLEAAVNRAMQFWKVETKYEAPIASALEHWGYSAKSSGGRLTVAAMLNYGLMSDRGSNENRMLKLTPLAVELMMTPTEEAKLVALKKAAQKPRVFAEVLKDYDPQNLPSDQTLAHYLVTKKGFNPAGTETFIKNFRKTIAYAKLANSDTMPNIKSTGEEPQNGDQSKVQIGAWIQWESGGVLQLPQARQVVRISEDGKFVFVEGSTTGLPIGEVTVIETAAPAKQTTSAASSTTPTPMPQRGFKQDVYTLGEEGQVILQWPEKMSKESYAELDDWLKLQMRKIARLNSIPPKPDDAK